MQSDPTSPHRENARAQPRGREALARREQPVELSDMLAPVWWNERVIGGRAKGLVFLLHPGPSLLVTATFIAVTGLAERAMPSLAAALKLTGLMLPIQFAIGVMNDVADVRADSPSKPYKPLVRGLISRGAAALLGVLLALIGLGVAATINVQTLLFALGGLAAGLSYDLGLRRTVCSFVPWWAGMSFVPLAAYAAADRLSTHLLTLLPLSLLVALALHCANSLPDVSIDRAAGRRSLPVILGERASHVMSVGALIVAGFVAITVLRPAAQLDPLLIGAAALLAALIAAALMLRIRRPFPVLAVGTAVFAVSWLAGPAT